MATILLIDDNEAVRRATQLMLEQSGHTVAVLTTGRRAVTIIAISGGGRFAESAAYLRSAEKLGATLTLEKPFNARQLARAVDTVLDAESQAQLRTD